MADEIAEKQTEEPATQNEGADEERVLMRRRDFLQGLKKWSKAVVGGIVLGKLLDGSEAKANWVNRRGTWVNGVAGGWLNRGGSWVNGGSAWVNRTGGGWLNGHGGGGSWINRRGW